MKVTFFIDREQKRVVLADIGSDFVDILFSFLTLPLGSIVKLLNKQSGSGSLDNLYDSVQQLDDEYLQNEVCKKMLLNPRSAAAEPCKNLEIKNIHDQNPGDFYTCSSYDCLVHSVCYYSYTSKCLCTRCGKLMDKLWQWKKQTCEEEGVFVNRKSDFIITDDLRVIPTSFKSLFIELQINKSVLEEKVVDFGTKEALTLLRSSFVTKSALTSVCFPHSRIEELADYSLLIKKEMVVREVENESKINITLYMENNNVLCAEVREDFVNQLFSFLTFPLGSVLGILSGHALQSCCINNLYSSAKSMSLDYFKSKELKDMLVNPNLSTFYGVQNQILELKEAESKKFTVLGSCATCYMKNNYKTCASPPCKHGISAFDFIEQDPKLVKGVKGSSGVFVTGSRSYMVTDDLHISPLSFISAICNGINLTTPNLVIKEISIDEDKLQSLLGAMLISKKVLTDVFSPKHLQTTSKNYK